MHDGPAEAGRDFRLRDGRSLADDQAQNEAEEPLRETSGDDNSQGENRGEDDDLHFT